MRHFLHLARNAFRECLREPVFLLLLFAALFGIGLLPTMTMFVFYEQAKMVTDSAMATTMVFSLVAAVLCAAHTVTREIRNGTVLLLLSKPVPRWVFVQAKLAGVLAALTLFVFICNTATFVSLRVAKEPFRLDYLAFHGYFLLLASCLAYGASRNYFARKSFPASSVYALTLLLPLLVLFLHLIGERGAPGFQPALLPAMALLFFAAWTMGAITVALATRLPLSSNLICSATLFMVGLVADYLRGCIPASSSGSRLVGGILYAAIPNWQFFWVADALAAKQPIPWPYVGWAGLYVLLYLLLCGLLAVTLFGGREVGDENVVA